MSKDPAKDFGPIADDYAFFERHGTEAENDCRAYIERIGPMIPAAGPIRFLDFGCGFGGFTARFLERANWPRERLWLTLVEPVEAARHQAATSMSDYTAHPVFTSSAISRGTTNAFEVVLANHVLYYVTQLQSQLAELVGALSPGGIFTTAIASRTNALIEFWIVGFRLIGREVTYHTSPDVEAALKYLGLVYRKQEVPYRLEFPDSEPNRMRILRFLFAEYLAQMPLHPLLDLFDRYSNSCRVTIETASDHFTVHSSQEKGFSR